MIKITIKEGKVYFILDKFSSVEITKGKNIHISVGNQNTYNIKPVNGIC